MMLQLFTHVAQLVDFALNELARGAAHRRVVVNADRADLVPVNGKMMFGEQ